MDFTCENTLEFLQRASHSEMFCVLYNWLIIDPFNQSIPSYFSNNFLLNINSNVFIATKYNSSDNLWIMYDIYHIFNIKKFIRLYMPEVGTIINNKEIKILDNYNQVLIRQNMNRMNLLSGAVVVSKIRIPYYDWLINEEPKTRDLDALTKYHIPLTANVGDYYNLTFKFVRHITWGYLHADTGWDGVIREMMHNNLDFAASAVYMRKDRASVTRYTSVGFFRQDNAFLFRHPKMTKGVRNVFLRPLTDDVWEAAALYSILLMVLLKIILHTEFYLSDGERNQAGFDNGYYRNASIDNNNWSSCVMIILGSITQQGSICSPPNLLSGRFMILSLLLFSLIYYQFYSASVVSSLLQLPPKTLKTLKQLLDSNLELAIELTPYTIDWFTNTNNSLELALYRNKILTTDTANKNQRVPRIWSIADGVRIIQDGGKAFHVSLNNAYKLIRETWSEREMCELSAIKLRNTREVFIMLHKQSQYRNIFNVAIIRQFENGIVNYQLGRWRFKKPECTLDLEASTFNVAFEDIYFALVVLLVGMLSSILLMIMEHYVGKLEIKERLAMKMKTQQKFLKKKFC